jgi:hypothetical protein
VPARGREAVSVSVSFTAGLGLVAEIEPVGAAVTAKVVDSAGKISSDRNVTQLNNPRILEVYSIDKTAPSDSGGCVYDFGTSFIM